MSEPACDPSAAEASGRRLRWAAAAGLIAIAAGMTVFTATRMDLTSRLGYFNPTLAVMLLLAAYRPVRRTGLALVLAIPAAAAIGILLVKQDIGWVIYPSLPFVLLGYLAHGACGFGLRGVTTNGQPAKVIGTAFVGAALFFLISNFGVWLVGFNSAAPSYPMTLEGLAVCYERALPFFEKQLFALALVPALFSRPVLDLLCVRQSRTVSASPALAVAETR